MRFTPATEAFKKRLRQSQSPFYLLDKIVNAKATANQKKTRRPVKFCITVDFLFFYFPIRSFTPLTDKFTVNAVLFHKLDMCALLNYPAVIYNNDLIGNYEIGRASCRERV